MEQSECLADLLSTFDGVRWSAACREMQVRVLHGNIESAVGVLRRFAGDSKIPRATMESAVCSVFDVRTTNQLESAGYLTLRAVDGATDADLFAITNIGDVVLGVIRQTLQRVKDGFMYETAFGDEDMIERELFGGSPELSRLEMGKTMSTGTSNTTPISSGLSAIEAAIRTITSNGGETLRVLDEKIVKLEDELDAARALRRSMAKMIGTTKADSAAKAKKLVGQSMISLEEEVYQALMSANGSMACEDVAEQLKVLPLQVGRVVANSTRMYKRGKIVEVVK